jgi:hypothetical protein
LIVEGKALAQRWSNRRVGKEVYQGKVEAKYSSQNVLLVIDITTQAHWERLKKGMEYRVRTKGTKGGSLDL